MWVLPSLGRPARCQALLDSLIAHGTTTPGVVLVDGPSDGYRALRLPQGWHVDPKDGSTFGLGPRLNAFFAAHPALSWYGILTDDWLVRTPRWDAVLLAAHRPFAITHSDDGWRAAAGALRGAQIFDGTLLRAWGFWCLPGLRHLYVDNFWLAMIARGAATRRFVPEVLVEDLHPENGKAPMDETYRRAWSHVAADGRVYQDFVDSGGLEAAATRVRDAKAAFYEGLARSRHTNPARDA